MKWLNAPPSWSEDGGGALRLRTASGTDFWCKTHYGFVRDNGHFRHERVSGDFVARVRIEKDGYQPYEGPLATDPKRVVRHLIKLEPATQPTVSAAR